ncbi:MAG: long-chain acyl-CoA synthetase [Frankiaceae bacterium]|nr:long-chain acyl-CoA synthetase [Frankiaceae bacterium]
MVETIARVLDRPLVERPDAEAVVARSGRLTYRELDTAADRAAGAFAALGMRTGDHVAVSLPNDLDVVIAFHGAMRLGLVWIGLNTALAGPEKAQILQDSGARFLLDGSVDWAGLVASASASPAVDVDPHAPAGIAYTSGTTGLPRGVVHSQHNLLLPGAVLVAERGYDAALRKGDSLPLTILNLMVLTTLLTAQAGGCCVVMDRRDPEGVLDWVRDERVTVWNGVPTQLFDLARGYADRRADLATLTEVWSGGGDCPDSLRAEFADAFGLPVRATYGLTEAPTVVAMDPVGGEWRPGSSGRALPHLRVQTLDQDGVDVGPGELGEISVHAAESGPWAGRWTPMLGEWSKGRLRAGRGSLLRTGDLGVLDEEGWVHIRDRRKLVVVRGGANIYPAEVERVLLSVPGVVVAAAFGVPSERLGEELAAVVQPAPGAGLTVDALEAVCRAELARYKVPEHWAIVEVLPVNAMGKVIRAQLPALLDREDDQER